MKTFRIVLGILAIIPLALLADHIFIHPDYYGEDSLQQKVYMILGVPILTFNLWAWIFPEIIEFYFFGKKGKH